jgi:phosphoribosyl 1,2-cyclic phosphodiesterase
MGANTLRFWGTRGGIAAPGPYTQRYGGNTSCIELRCGPHLLILDAGTGLRAMGVGSTRIDADLLLTHTHLDHIQGLGFFEPLGDPGTRLRIHGGHLPEPELRAALTCSLSPPLMPPIWSSVQANVHVGTLPIGQPTALHPGLMVTPGQLRHPGNAVGFRIDYQGQSVAYVTDTEHLPGERDAAVVRLARGADVFIYDSNYTDDEFPQRVGWGHSTWEEGVRLADAAGVRQLVLFHHDPSRTDGQLDAIVSAAAAARPGTIAAAEGLVVSV